MKKFACIILALALCLGMAAMAESVPSRTTTDMVQFEATAENMPADAAVIFTSVATIPAEEMTPEQQEKVAVCDAELQKLAASESVEAYFGEVTDAQGNPVQLTEALGTDQLNVFEFFPLNVEGYEEEYGAVTTTMLLSTPYAEGDTVAVLIGVVTVNEDGAQSVAWQMFEGVGLAPVEGQEETTGRIQVTLPPEIITQIHNGTALMAVISR